MVRVLTRGKHHRTPPSERLVCLEGIGLGVPELLFGPGPLPDPLPDDPGCAVLCCVVLCCVVLHCVVLCCAALCCAVLRRVVSCVVLCGVVSCGVVWYGVVAWGGHV